MSYDKDLVHRLQNHASGADIHIRNKARWYYTYHKIKPETRKKLETMIRVALATNDWKPLRFYMQRWF